MTYPYYGNNPQQPLVQPQRVADGVDGRLRGDRTGGTVVQHEHGEMYEEVARGNVWTISTAVAGVSPVTTVGIITTAANPPILGIFNPTIAPNTVNLHITRAVLTVCTGTVVTGGFVWGMIPTPTGITSVGVNARNNLSFGKGGHKAVAFDGSAAVTGGALPTLFRPFGAPFPGAISAGQQATLEETETDIVVAPGCYAGLYAAIGATGLNVVASISWAEVAT